MADNTSSLDASDSRESGHARAAAEVISRWRSLRIADYAMIRYFRATAFAIAAEDVDMARAKFLYRAAIYGIMRHIAGDFAVIASAGRLDGAFRAARRHVGSYWRRAGITSRQSISLYCRHQVGMTKIGWSSTKDDGVATQD